MESKSSALLPETKISVIQEFAGNITAISASPSSAASQTELAIQKADLCSLISSSNFLITQQQHEFKVF